MKEEDQPQIPVPEAVTNTPTVVTGEAVRPDPKINASRKDLQLPRRMVHLFNGLMIAFIYGYFLTHSVAVHILGTFACIFYIFEQLRINYPEYSQSFNSIGQYLFRAEEQLKESSMIPYIMGLLLTIISFPKSVAICSILTLGVADPLSAIVGIKYGRLRIVKEKSVEGSLAFFIACFVCIYLPLYFTTTNNPVALAIMAFIASIIIAIFEMLPIRLDDNLTIPLFCGLTILIMGNRFGIYFY